jgi:hypothetical protein
MAIMVYHVLTQEHAVTLACFWNGCNSLSVTRVPSFFFHRKRITTNFPCISCLYICTEQPDVLIGLVSWLTRTELYIKLALSLICSWEIQYGQRQGTMCISCHTFLRFISHPWLLRSRKSLILKDMLHHMRYRFTFQVFVWTFIFLTKKMHMLCIYFRSTKGISMRDFIRLKLPHWQWRITCCLLVDFMEN